VIVNSSCGYSVSIDDPSELIRNIAEIVAQLHADREKLRSLAESASRRIAEDFDDSNYSRGVEDAYQQALENP